MKLFSFLVLFVLMPITFAGPNASVFHAHDGRIHSHPLPEQGLSHRHGAGSLGVIAKSTNAAGNVANVTSNTGRISSSVVYGGSQTVVPTKPPIKHPPRRQVIISNQGTSTHTANTKFTKGDFNCSMGQADCNVCAVNVQQYFRKATSQQISWKSQPWLFNWPSTYPPQRKRPLDIFNGDAAYALGIPDKHIQGFVKTNSSLYPYAGSHSHKKNGGIFFIKRGDNGKNYLGSLHQLAGRHPSGVHVIGKYLVYGMNDRLYFKDINSRNQQSTFNLKIPKPGFGGGLGVLKLSKDNHLIITSGPGGQDKRPRYNRFYHLKSINGRPVSITLISESASIKPAKWPSSLTFSENLSLITECGSGDIYSIHTSGDEKGVLAISGNGYWRLSKLVSQQNRLSLKPISAFASRQNMSSCNIRAAATVHVNEQHQLEFYCHAYAKDPDGSTFNVLGKSSRGIDKFYFKKGTIR